MDKTFPVKDGANDTHPYEMEFRRVRGGIVGEWSCGATWMFTKARLLRMLNAVDTKAWYVLDTAEDEVFLCQKVGKELRVLHDEAMICDIRSKTSGYFLNFRQFKKFVEGL